MVPLSEEALEEIQWWLAHMEAWNSPDLVIESNTSGTCWEACLWSSQEQPMHINCLELLAGSFAFWCGTRDRTQSCVLLKMDKVAAVHYINHLEGT